MKFEAEQRIRERAAAVALDWYREHRGEFEGSSGDEFADMISASHIAADEGRLALHRWVDAGRRAGLSWTDIGARIGISKQAAQQRFGSGAETVEPTGEGLVVVGGATALNEMRLLRQEGEAGRELVEIGPLKLFFRQTDRAWEYRRVTAMFAASVRGDLEREGWTYVSSWLPFHYFKRASA